MSTSTPARLDRAARRAGGPTLRRVHTSELSKLRGLRSTFVLLLAALASVLLLGPVNAVGPGPIGTELFHRVNPADSPLTKAIIDGVPVKRLGKPEDIAHAAAFLLDERAGFVTGQVLYVCGGMTVGLSS